MGLSYIVARYRDGRTIKGTSLNVDPSRQTCHVTTDERRAVEVKLLDLKALFFVKDPTGNAAHNEATDATPGDTRLVGAKRIAVHFEDGEIVVGMVNRFPPMGRFFFMIPIDPKSNNLRILVNRVATRRIVEAMETPAR